MSLRLRFVSPFSSLPHIPKGTVPVNPVEASIPDAPTFYPTKEEFQNPMRYVGKRAGRQAGSGQFRGR